MNKKKLQNYILFFFFCIIISIFFFSTKSEASIKKTGIENFPASYQPYLYALKKKYPKWEFTALYTGLDWNYSVSQEYRNNKNLVPISYSDYWKCTDEGIYNVEIDKGWVNASKSAVEYTMDPRSFLNEVRLFQFEKLSYDPNINSKEGIEKILYGTEFYQRQVSYRNAQGAIFSMDANYSDLMMNAGIYSGVSPYHLASRIKQEVGPFITHHSISGSVAGFEGLYNFYNIGATSSTEPMGAIKNGLAFARDGKGASEEVKNNLILPWDNPEKAIKGGAVFIGKSYIGVGQNTLYLQKFDVNDDRGNDLFWHQYMTNCLAPYSESSSIYKAYSSNGMLDSSIGFVIPVYENMPEYATESPNILASDFQADNTKMFADITGSLNIRSGPSTSYEVLTTITKNTIVTRIKKGIQNGERWDKVQLENGMVGYVFQSYLKEVPEPTITKLKLSMENTVLSKGSTTDIKVQTEPVGAKEEIIWSSSDENVVTVENGVVKAIASGTANITATTKSGKASDTIQITVYTPITSIILSKESIEMLVGNTIILTANVLPEDASQVDFEWSSSDSNIIQVTQEGKITAIAEGEAEVIVRSKTENIQVKCHVIVKKLGNDVQLEFTGGLRVQANEISNLQLDKSLVKDIKSYIQTNLIMEFYNIENAQMKEEEQVGTGCKLVLKDGTQQQVLQFTFIIYGDVNGDGLINSLDVLVMQKHILEVKQLKQDFLKAGNISKNGSLPTSLDVLKIQKHILEMKFIEQ